MSDGATRAAVARVCRLLSARSLIAGADGNVSVRLPSDRVLVTPSGGSKREVRPGALLEVALEDGRVLAGVGRASSELAMHLAIYRGRPDVTAVVHAHPPTATAFAVAGEPIPARVLPELACQVGPVATVPYFTPGTPAAGAAFAPFLADHDAFLMANHGAATVGPSLEAAHLRMESLEHAARILLAARLLGRVTPLTEAQFAALPTRRAPEPAARLDHRALAGHGAASDGSAATLPERNTPRTTRPPIHGGEDG